MSKVVSLDEAREASTPHWQGPVHCAGCQHEWHSVAPAGKVTGLQCPECECFKGVSIHLMGTEEDELYQCNCGSWFFSILKGSRVMCVNCGIVSDIDD